IDVLATTTQKVRPWDPWHREVTSPAIWTRRWGKGRIFVTTPGHSLDVLRDDTVRTILDRGMLCAARELHLLRRAGRTHRGQNRRSQPELARGLAGRYLEGTFRWR